MIDYEQKGKEFEENDFFDDILRKSEEEVYYIGFNANNAICNNSFFGGTITLYPTRERDNIYYSAKKLDDIKSSLFLNNYKKFIYKSAKKIQKKNVDAKFICFNENIRNLCVGMKELNIVKSNAIDVIEFLNNKFKTRQLVADVVPVLDYIFVNGDELRYESVVEKMKCDRFVVQGETGSSGNSTFLVSCEKDLENINSATKYCISKYVEHLPLNATLIISEEKTLTFPMSVQLILLTNNMFKYVGGDFIYSQNLNKEVYKKIDYYNNSIAEKVRAMGYRGIIGIDYILCENNDVIFMEINPRFQSSSFIISLELQKEYGVSIAELHYQAMINSKMKDITLNKINKSFVNCSNSQEYQSLKDYEVIENGYFKENNSSVYRKVFNYSIIEQLDFEKL